VRVREVIEDGLEALGGVVDGEKLVLAPREGVVEQLDAMDVVL